MVEKHKTSTEIIDKKPLCASDSFLCRFIPAVINHLTLSEITDILQIRYHSKSGRVLSNSHISNLAREMGYRYVKPYSKPRYMGKNHYAFASEKLPNASKKSVTSV